MQSDQEGESCGEEQSEEDERKQACHKRDERVQKYPKALPNKDRHESRDQRRKQRFWFQILGQMIEEHNSPQVALPISAAQIDLIANSISFSDNSYYAMRS